MKKIVFIILILFITNKAKAQFSINQNIGSGVTLVQVPTPGGFRASIINRTFIDTTQANTTPIAFYAGAQIFCSSTNTIWYRNATATKWFELSSGGSSVNIYNSDGTLTGNRTLTGSSNSLTFSGLNTFKVEGASTIDIGTPQLQIGIQLPSTIVAGDSVLVRSNSSGGRVKVISKTDLIGGSSWLLTGNLGTTAGTNFIGTTDSIGFMGKVNNQQAMYLNVNLKNSSFGLRSLIFNTSGFQNVAIGQEALYSNSTGQQNTALGYQSLFNNTTASSQTAVGWHSLYTSVNNIGNTAVGSQAAELTNTARNTAIGAGALQAGGGGLNTSVGFASMPLATTGYSNTAVGVNSLFVATTGFQNTSIGAGSMESLTTGQENTGVGYDAGLNATTAIRNVWLGWNAKSGTDGANNVMIGYRTGASLTAGNSNNVFVGSQSGDNASQKVDAVNSIAIGQGTFTTSDNQVILGNNSIAETILRGNVGIGTTSPTASLHVVPGTATTSYGKIGVYDNDAGYFRFLADGGTIYSGISCELSANPEEGINITYTDGVSTSNINFNTDLVLSANNVLMQTSSGNVGIGTPLPSNTLHVNGSFRLVNGSQSNGYVLQSDANGVATWVNPTSFTPPWQQTLTAGSTLNTDNTIDGGANSITFDNFRSYGFAATEPSGMDVTLAGLTGQVSVDAGNASMIGDGGGKTSRLTVYRDSIWVRPHLGQYYIDTLSNLSTQNTLIGWKQGSGQGAVGYITIGTGLSLSSGTLTASGGSPAGNFGNIQINRNGAFATPGSDSLDFESATGLSVKGDINSDAIFKSSVTSGDILEGAGGAFVFNSAGSGYANFGRGGMSTLYNGTGCYFLVSSSIIANITSSGLSVGNSSTSATATVDVTGTFTTSGVNTLSNLAGTGSRTVLADASGVLSAPVSDRSVKKNINQLNDGLSIVMKLKPVSFEYKEGWKNYGEGRQVGFIAQDIQNVMPNSTYITPTTGKMGYNEQDIIPILVKAVQEQQAEIEQLKKEIKQLKHK